MADLAAWVTAAEPALGWEDGAFLDAYAVNRATAHELALDGSALASALRDLLPESGGTWQGTSSELLDTLVSAVGQHEVDRLLKRKAWPASPRGLAGDLRRLAPNLRAVGIEVTFEREARRRLITIVREGGATTVTTVTTVTGERGEDDGRGTVVTQQVTVGPPSDPAAEHDDDGRDAYDGRIPTHSSGLWDPEHARDDDAEVGS